MKCSYCRFELDNRQTVCPNCGAPIEYQTTLSHSVNVQKNTERSKAVYIWTAILFGGFGIHDFYAGSHLKGIIKVILFLTIIGVYISWIWAIIDACTVRKTKTVELFT